jgi:hypothetical protein
LRTEGIGITKLGVHSLRNFYFEHPVVTYAAALAWKRREPTSGLKNR